MQNIQKQKLFLIASIVPHTISNGEAFRELKESKELVDTYGGKVVEYIIQRREIHDKGHYLGKGKIEEVNQYVKSHSIDIVVLNAAVKPAHIYDMKHQLELDNPNVEIWDRVDLILQIFSKHAHTTEARLQIELAAMRHMGPRIYGMGYVLSRQDGSIGTRGIGETNTELMKRHWRSQMKRTQDKLRKLEKDHLQQLERRRKLGLQTISIVGYTNAGKTSLFNLLTKKKNYVEHALFATLDASVGKIALPGSKKTILISDTIGFIRNLPTSLIDAFTSTLMESIYADLLVHVVDSNDEDLKGKIQAVEEVLSTLRVFHKKTIFVFNKSDLLSEKQKKALKKLYIPYSPVFISAKKGTGIDMLYRTIMTLLPETTQTMTRPKHINTGWTPTSTDYSYDAQ